MRRGVKKIANKVFTQNVRISKILLEKMEDPVWCCSNCEIMPNSTSRTERKIFERYVEEVICTVKSTPETILNATDQLHNNHGFTVETFDKKGARF